MTRAARPGITTPTTFHTDSVVPYAETLTDEERHYRHGDPSGALRLAAATAEARGWTKRNPLPDKEAPCQESTPTASPPPRGANGPT